MSRIKQEFHEFRLLMQAVPTLLVVFFVLSVLSMNLLANKSLNIPFSWLALDAGIIVSWFAFLSMDIIATYFGPKAATQISVLAILINLLFCLLFFVGSRLPGTWGESYVEGSETVINLALDHTFGGTWYVVAGSTLAFLVSAVVNNTLNASIGRLFRDPHSLPAYILRTHISTAVGQFVDNLTFALVVSHVFFGWTLTQCITCAITGMLCELLCESLFSGFGYKLCTSMRRDNVGEEYLRLQEAKKAA